MKRSLRIRVAAAVATAAMVVSAATPAFALSLKISGSTTLFPLASKWASVYKSQHSGSSITVVGGGSGKGISDVKAGIVSIGMSSRMKQASDGGSVLFTPVARDALAIVINGKFYAKYSRYIYRLTQTQVQQIFRGQVTNWRQVDSHLPSHAIDLVGRTGSSGTYTYFKQMFLMGGSAQGLMTGSAYKQSARTRTYASNGIVRSTVASDMYAIGYLSEAYVDSSVHALQLPTPAHYYDLDYQVHDTPASQVGKYVAPSGATASNGTYKYVRPLYLVTVGSPSGDSKTFIDWCLSSAGQAYCQSQHYLKIK